MKEQRQKLILEIIAEMSIETQEELLQALMERGCRTTQATVSRDIRELRLVKELSPDGVSRYSAGSRKSTVLKDAVVCYDLAQNLVVIKTNPGLAPAVCAALDSMNFPDLIGTIAGDDTCLLILKTDDTALKFYNELGKLLH